MFTEIGEILAAISRKLSKNLIKGVFTGVFTRCTPAFLLATLA